ncbi:hypothetical protein HDF11_000521 [Tunturiibacter psychrotolerans]
MESFTRVAEFLQGDIDADAEHQMNKLKTAFGAPAVDNKNTAGARGPTLLQDICVVWRANQSSGTPHRELRGSRSIITSCNEGVA